ncbi:hypothetical protein niasHT_021410 [Heterodera trifolii]|uniref:Uncharacterized protein n=1 Tax=Heterodera trifolii TaxID=157864 RepID=A0ABD2K6N3_9BILA
MSSDDPDKAAAAKPTDEATAKDGPAPDTPSDAKVTDGGPPTATEDKPKEQTEAKVPDEPSTTKEPTAPVTDGPPSEAKGDKSDEPKVPDEPATKVPDEPPATEPPKDSATTEGSDEPSTDTSKDSATTEGSEEEAPAPEPPKAPEDQPKKADEKKSEEEAPAPEPPKAPEDQPKKADKKKSEEAPAKEPKKKADKKKKSKSEESVASVSVRLQPRKVPVNSFKDVRPTVQKSLAGLKYPFIKKLEKQAGMDREKLFYSALAFLSLYLMVGPGNTLLSALIVKAWPVYQTILAVHTQNRKDDTQWLAFWCAFAAFSVLDHFFAPLEPLFGLYLLFKTAALLYLGLPQTYGAHNLYVKHVHPLVDQGTSTAYNEGGEEEEEPNWMLTPQQPTQQSGAGGVRIPLKMLEHGRIEFKTPPSAQKTPTKSKSPADDKLLLVTPKLLSTRRVFCTLSSTRRPRKIAPQKEGVGESGEKTRVKEEEKRREEGERDGGDGMEEEKRRKIANGKEEEEENREEEEDGRGMNDGGETMSSRRMECKRWAEGGGI